MSQITDQPITIPQVLPWLGEEEQTAVMQAVASGWITEGPRAAEFSARLNTLMNVPYGVFAPNGTLALYLGLLALGIGPGDEVLVPDITFIASANAVVLAKATPVFVDVTADNYQIDVSQCEALVTHRTRAIMPVHLYGMTANLDEVMKFARQHNLLVIEDAAQAIGVRYRGQHAGTFGEVGCFSFFADKTITTGEGGYVVCRDSALYERLRLLRNQGRLDRGTFIHPAIGYNFRLTDVQAALGLAQLAKLQATIERKLHLWNWYRRELENVPQIRLLPIELGSEFVPFRMVILCSEAHPLMTYLRERGVQTRTVFYPLHRQPCFTYLSHTQGGPLDLEDVHYPNALCAYEQGVLLPIFPTLTEGQINYIGSAIRDFFSADSK